MLTTLIYSGIVIYVAQDTLYSYKTTKAPTALKTTRNLLNLAILAHCIFLGIFTIYTLGEQALLDLVLGDGKTLIQNLPLPFIFSFIALEAIKTGYKLWKTLITNTNAPLKIKEITFNLIRLGIMSIIALSASSIISQTLLAPSLQGNLIFLFWAQIINEAYNAYEKGQLNITIDWQFVAASIYLNLTTAILLTLMTLQVITLGGVLFNSILCFKAAAYLFANSLIEFYNDAKITNKLLVQVAVAVIQVTFGALLLTNLLIIPESAILGILLLAVIKNLSFLPTIDSMKQEAIQQQEIQNKYKLLFAEIDNPNEMSSESYINQCHETMIQAKKNVLPSNQYSGSFFYNADRGTNRALDQYPRHRSLHS